MVVVFLALGLLVIGLLVAQCVVMARAAGVVEDWIRAGRRGRPRHTGTIVLGFLGWIVSFVAFVLFMLAVLLDVSDLVGDDGCFWYSLLLGFSVFGIA